MKLGIPQVIVLAAQFISLGINMAKHNKPYNEKYNGWAKFIAVAITLGVLYWGGFFK